MDYADFTLRIARGDVPGQYRVETSSTLGFETRDPILHEISLESLAAPLAALEQRALDADGGRDLGTRLRALLFPEAAWALFERAFEAAEGTGRGLRLRLRVGPPELARVPWEYCYDETRGYLALDRRSPLVRYIAGESGIRPVRAPRPLRLLVAYATPLDLDELDVPGERARIDAAVAEAGDAIEVTHLEHATPDTLRAALARLRPHLFHFVGHGRLRDGQGTLALEGEGQIAVDLDAEQLRVMLAGGELRVVLLNACRSAAFEGHDASLGIAPALVDARLPAVIAMQFEVPDRAALGFTRDFYRSIAAALPLDLAVTEMRIGAFAAHERALDWGIPALFLRAADGALWTPPEEEGEPDTARPTGNTGINISGISGSQISVSVEGDVVGGSKSTIGGSGDAGDTTLLTRLDALLERVGAGPVRDALEEARERVLSGASSRRIVGRLRDAADATDDDEVRVEIEGLLNEL